VIGNTTRRHGYCQFAAENGPGIRFAHELGIRDGEDFPRSLEAQARAV
jgi:hypothetical protein